MFRSLLCVRVCVAGGRCCVQPVRTRRPSSLPGPALWCVCGTYHSTMTNSLTWNSDRLVCSLVCLRFIFLNAFFIHKWTQTHFFFAAVIRSHRFSDVPGCVWGAQPYCKWLPWPHLYPVGHGGAQLHHPLSRSHYQHLCTSHQWPHCKSTFRIPFCCNLRLALLSKSLFLLFFVIFPHRRHVFARQSAHSLRKREFSLLTACISCLHVFCFFGLLFVYLCAHGRQHLITL